jgi:hypothetical protein
MKSIIEVLPNNECVKLPSVWAVIRSEDDRAPLGVRVFFIGSC